MNRRGQTLVIFIIVLPIFALLAAFAIDSGSMIKTKTKLKSITEMVIRDNIDDLSNTNLINDIKNIYAKNDIPTDNLKILVSTNKLIVSNYYSINSIFGYLIGNDKYNISIKLTGYYNNDKIIIEKG